MWYSFEMVKYERNPSFPSERTKTQSSIGLQQVHRANHERREKDNETGSRKVQKEEMRLAQTFAKFSQRGSIRQRMVLQFRSSFESGWTFRWERSSQAADSGSPSILAEQDKRSSLNGNVQPSSRSGDLSHLELSRRFDRNDNHFQEHSRIYRRGREPADG